MLSRSFAKGDTTNPDIKVFRLRAVVWILISIVSELLLGFISLVTFVISLGDVKTHGNGVTNFIYVLLLSTAIFFRSKTLFTILSIYIFFDSLMAFYLFFARLIIAIEYPPASDSISLILWFLNTMVSSILLIVFLRLSWCNGLDDHEDVERKALLDIIKEADEFKCTRCELFRKESLSSSSTTNNP